MIPTAIRKPLHYLGTALAGLGIRCQLFLVVCEGEDVPEYPAIEAPFTAGFLKAADRDAAHQLEPWRSNDEVDAWFAEGQRVFGVKHGTRLVARMCCNLEQFDFPGCYRALESDEVYLHSACVDPAMRGQDIAPRMRQACYASMGRAGGSRFYSTTKFLNVAARRFKQKLNARDTSLLFYIELFGKWSGTLTVWRFDP